MPDGDEDIQKELKSLQAVTKGFRSHIECARNKLLAHLDRGAVLISGKTFGEFPEGEDKMFFNALEKMCNIIHEACFETIYGDMNPRGPGDVFNLTKTLRQAVAFDVALSKSSGQNKTWLIMCLDKAGHETALH